MSNNRVRRNGLLSSCEPCRRSKLGCDHVRPQCGRCVRRRLRPEQCHYHPAPMSKAKSPRPTLQTFVHDASASEAAAALVLDSFSATAADNADHATSLIGMNEFSYHALAEDVQRHDRMFASLDRKGVVAPGPRAEKDTHLLARGVRLLETLLGLASYLDEAFAPWVAKWDEQTSLGPIEKPAFQSTHAMLSALRQIDSPEALRERSRTLTEHTSRCVSYPHSAEDKALCKTFAEQGLRWELVGMYCARIGMYFGRHDQVISLLNTRETPGSDRRTLMCRAFFAGMESAALCAALGQVNDLTLFQLCTTVHLATWCFGDDSYHVWQLLGDVTSVVYSLKYHKPSVITENVPRYLAELRKRAVGQVHEHDKSTATFVGRPPRLNRQYCKMELPLDLANEVIEGPTEALENAVSLLGKDGWGRSEAITPASRQRVAMILCPLREEVLELSLGSSIADLVPRAQSVLSRLTLAWQSIPFASDHIPDWKNQPWLSSVLRFFARLEYLYTKFLLHKLLVGHDLKHRLDLLYVAHEILSLVLSTFKQRIMILAHRLDMEWTLVFYAMPCASVLLCELLGWTQGLAITGVPNRATLIRDISTLITCCDWLVESGESNHAICRQAQTIFSGGLDIVLNSSNPPRVEQERANYLPTDFQPDASGAYLQDPQWIAWLETVDLQSDFWQTYS